MVIAIRNNTLIQLTKTSLVYSHLDDEYMKKCIMSIILQTKTQNQQEQIFAL